MPLLSHSINEFLEFKKAQHLSQRTLADYEIILRRFSKEIGDVEIDQIDRKTVVHYLASLQLSKKRVKNIHITLSSFWTWAVSEGYCSSHIIRQIKPPRPEKRPIVRFTREQILSMLESTRVSRAFAGWYNGNDVRRFVSYLARQYRQDELLPYSEIISSDEEKLYFKVMTWLN
jgi:site-specific recombinase XerD